MVISVSAEGPFVSYIPDLRYYATREGQKKKRQRKKEKKKDTKTKQERLSGKSLTPKWIFSHLGM